MEKESEMLAIKINASNTYMKKSQEKKNYYIVVLIIIENKVKIKNWELFIAPKLKKNECGKINFYSVNIENLFKTEIVLPLTLFNFIYVITKGLE